MADTNVVVGASLKVDAGNTTQTVSQVREQIKLYKQELDNATVGSEAHRAALQKLEAANKSLNPTFNEQASTLSAVNSHLSNTLPAFGKASQGAQSFGTMLKALMANPIVLLIAAIVAGLKFLYDAFTSTTAGAKQAAQAFAGIEQVVKVLFERVMAVGRALIELFSGHFKKAWNDGKAALSGVVEEVERTYAAAVEGTRKLQELKILRRQEDLANARADAEIAKLRESILDEDIPIKQRIANAERVKVIDKARSEEAIRNAKAELAAKMQIWSTEFEFQKKHADEINELNIAIADKEKEAAQSLRATERSERQLNKQQDAEDSAKEKEAEEKNKEARDKARDAERQRRENQKAYNDKLLKLHQDEELATIKDQTVKKLKELQFELEKENAAIEQDFKDKKISSAQRTILLENTQKVFLNKIAEVNEAHDAEELKKKKDHDAAMLKQQQDDQKKTDDLALKEMALKISMSKGNIDLQKKELDLKQKLIDDQYKREIAAANLTALQKREIELNHAEQTFQISQSRIAISKAEKDARLADADAIGSALSGLSNLIGQQTVVGKGLAVASAIINTYTGATKALAQGGIAGIAGAAGVIASGLASVQKIIATKIPGQSSGGSAPSVSSSSPLQPQPVNQTTTLDQNSINQIGNATARVFVLDADIKNNRERIERINRAARL